MDEEIEDEPTYRFDTLSEYAGYEIRTRQNASRNTHKFRVWTLLAGGMVLAVFANAICFWVFPTRDSQSAAANWMHIDLNELPTIFRLAGICGFLGGLVERVTFVIRYNK